jgi:lipoprotein-anchoring transpeptidase ErfK/SrfK
MADHEPPTLRSRLAAAARRLTGRRAAGDGRDPVPRLGVSPKLLAILVLITVAAGAADVWLARRAGQSVRSTAPRPTRVEATTGPPVAPPPDPYLKVVAEAAVRRVPVYEEPGDQRPRRRLASPTENGVPLVFLVQKEQGEWLRVLLPIRPNGSRGWIRRRDVTTTQHRFRIAVFLKSHRLLAFEGGELLLRAKVAIGTRDTPTPGGTYYIKELLKPPNPNTVYGTYAYGLSGYSNVLRSFGGGNGVIGIHGTNDPSVLGSDVSAGCIRMRNRDIEKLVRVLPLGTPVEIIG